MSQKKEKSDEKVTNLAKCLKMFLFDLNHSIVCYTLIKYQII